MVMVVIDIFILGWERRGKLGQFMVRGASL